MGRPAGLIMFIRVFSRGTTAAGVGEPGIGGGMADQDFNYSACSCRAVRTFRLRRKLPVMVEFFALRYTIELSYPAGTGDAEFLVARLPWQDLNYGRELDHAGRDGIRRRIYQAYDVDCGTLAEVLFLRLVRQGDAEELAGPHLKIRA
jgi:hypothetical protein